MSDEHRPNDDDPLLADRAGARNRPQATPLTRRAFESELEKDEDGTWWYVHVPADVRSAFKRYERRGITHVRVTVGGSTWEGSMLPWADGSAQISVNKSVRAREGLELGATVRITVRPR